MRFLANENFPVSSIKKLRQAGIDIDAIIEMMPGAKDQQVLDSAYKTGRIILTFDRDYGELIFRHELPVPAGVVYFRYAPSTPEEPAEYLLKLLAKDNIVLVGRFTVARQDQLRQRPLPKYE